MNRLILFSGFFFLLVFSTIHAQEGWDTLYCPGPGSDFQTCCFRESSTILVGGSALGWTWFGSIWITTNNGTSWNSGLYGFESIIHSLSFIDSLTGFYIEYDDCCGYLIKTTNGGLNWYLSLFPDSGRTASYSFVDSSRGLACIDAFPQNKIMKTTDGGESWYFKSFISEPGKIHYFNSQLAWLAGWNGFLAKSTNGGTSWNTMNSGVLSYFNDIRFFTTMKGIAIGENGVILRTTDGGVNWVISYPAGNISYRALSIVDTNYAWIVGSNGIILRTRDGGETFDIQQAGSLLLNSVDFYDSLRGIASASQYSSDSYVGILFQTTNGGVLWTELQREPVNHSFYLHQNYPNPFNPSTTIRYQISENSKVSLKIYNSLGQEVATLIDKRESEGSHIVQWNGKDGFGNAVASGVYLYRLDAISNKERFTNVKKMIYLK